MIPKTIHYCWFGESELPEEYQNYIKGWKELMPDFKIKRWDESNAPLYLPYLQTALENGNKANMSNFVRFHALYEEGGIYMDVDMEVIKNLEPLLKNQCFFGFEKGADPNETLAVNNAIMGAVPRHDFIKECKNYLLTSFSGKEYANLSSPGLVTTLLRAKGLIEYGSQILGDIKIYGEKYFYPYHWSEQYTDSCIHKNTFTIHHWAKSWHVTQKRTFLKKIERTIFRRLPYSLTILKNYGWAGYRLYKKRTVIDGPFKGMKYAKLVSIGSSLLPKLVGIYEECLHYHIYDLINYRYCKVINIGCGEGFYSVGLAKILPDVKVFAYDINEEAIHLTRLNSKINKVEKRVFPNCSMYNIENIKKENFKKKTLIFCDAEGYERELFKDNTIPFLKNVDFIIEIHDFLKEDTKKQIINVFSDSHDIILVKEHNRSRILLDFLNYNKSFRKTLKVFDEGRPELMEWAIIKSKAK